MILHQTQPIFPKQTGTNAGSDARAACVSALGAANWIPLPTKRSVVLPSQ